jgi:hypothetical protein
MTNPKIHPHEPIRGNMKQKYSLFWPLTFIAAGVVWLLITLKVIPAENLWALTHIWPYLLIALGLGLILRSIWRPLGAIMTVLVVLGLVAAVIFAPQLNWADARAWDITGWDLGGNTGGSVTGSGVTARETRTVAGFDAIKLRYPAEVTITQGSAESLTIEADDNLLPQLATTVKSGTLVIENKETNWSKRVNPKTTVKIHIVVKKLEEIDLPSAGSVVVQKLTSDKLHISMSGAGEITLSDLKVDDLSVDVSGAGSIKADGEAGKASISISGLGSFDGKGFAAQIAHVVISGAGSATLRVEQELKAEISGAGSVDYYGDPEVTRQVSGAGSVNKLGE